MYVEKSYHKLISLILKERIVIHIEYTMYVVRIYRLLLIQKNITVKSQLSELIRGQRHLDNRIFG